jgi:hypothetical protein
MASVGPRLGARRAGWLVRFTAALLLVMAAQAWLVAPATNAADTGSDPPDRDGYFSLRPVGSWSSLPSGGECRQRVHRSTWEPRPENAKENDTTPDRDKVRESFADRPRSDDWVNWNSWLLPRISGNFTGTTDEILQWAACKWGLPDNTVRAITVTESSWYQYLTYPGGRCVTHLGCGDFADSDRTYCDGLAKFGHDYQEDYGEGTCPGTFSIAGVMSYQDPDWGKWPANQNGAFPFNRDSTAFAVEYMAATLRGCYEGWERWLEHDNHDYAAGDLWGCIGVWYSGAWHSGAADDYIAHVKDILADREWLKPYWMQKQYDCDAKYGCPR